MIVESQVVLADFFVADQLTSQVELLDSSMNANFVLLICRLTWTLDL